MGILTHALPYEEVPGMEEYKEYLESRGKTIEDINMQYVAGWVTAKVMVQGAIHYLLLLVVVPEIDGFPCIQKEIEFSKRTSETP